MLTKLGSITSAILARNAIRDKFQGEAAVGAFLQQRVTLFLPKKEERRLLQSHCKCKFGHFYLFLALCHLLPLLHIITGFLSIPDALEISETQEMDPIPSNFQRRYIDSVTVSLLFASLSSASSDCRCFSSWVVLCSILQITRVYKSPYINLKSGSNVW